MRTHWKVTRACIAASCLLAQNVICQIPAEYKPLAKGYDYVNYYCPRCGRQLHLDTEQDVYKVIYAVHRPVSPDVRMQREEMIWKGIKTTLVWHGISMLEFL